MELRHLRYFVAVAEDLNFSRAAKRLNVSQPPLTQAIQKLEQELGLSLFLRTSRSVRLTEEGSLFFEKARNILSHVERAVSDLRQRRGGKKEILRIGCSGSERILPEAVRSFRQRFPDVRLELLSQGRTHRDSLLNREIDLNIGLYFPPDAELDSRWWVEARLMAVVPADHPWAGRPRIGIGQLREEPLLLPALPRGPTRDIVDLGREALRFCREVGRFEPRSFQHYDEAAVLAALVSSGAGVGIASGLLRYYTTSDIAFVPFREKAPLLRAGIVWRRDRMGPALSGFIEELEGRLRSVGQNLPGGPHLRPDLLACAKKSK